MNSARSTPDDAVSIVPLPAFNDNYLWLLRRGREVAVVDPGDAKPVLDYLRANDCRLSTILITHHHGDHIGGISALLAAADASLPVFGPALENIAGVTTSLHGGEIINLPALNVELEVLAVPGHTAGHVAYYGRKLGSAGALFCGDTLFGAGCGRLFEGTAAQMYDSLAKIAVLPAPTSLYCAHEYTAANLRFAAAVEPGNATLQARVRAVDAARAHGLATVPLTLSEELATNPFLRGDVPAVRAAAAAHSGQSPADACATFAILRHWKDDFR